MKMKDPDEIMNEWIERGAKLGKVDPRFREVRCPWCFSKNWKRLPEDKLEVEGLVFQCLDCLVFHNGEHKYKFTEFMNIRITKGDAMRLFQIKELFQSQGCHYGNSSYNQLQDIGFFRHVLDQAMMHIEQEWGYAFPRISKLPTDYEVNIQLTKEE